MPLPTPFNCFIFPLITRPSTWSLVRIDQTCFGRNNGFAPISLPYSRACAGVRLERNRISTSIRNVDRDPQTGESALEAFLYLFFSPSQRSQAAGKAFWERRHLRKNDVDPPSSPQTMAAHLAATNDWRQIKGGRFAELKRIGRATLVVNGSNDIMVPTINSFTLSQRIPNAQLIVYPDSGHAPQFQYPELFVAHARMFLDS